MPSPATTEGDQKKHRGHGKGLIEDLQISFLSSTPEIISIGWSLAQHLRTSARSRSVASFRPRAGLVKKKRAPLHAMSPVRPWKRERST